MAEENKVERKSEKKFVKKNFDNKKKLLYILFSIGVFLIVGSLVYTFMRIY